MSYSLSLSKAIMVVVFVSDKIEQGMYDFLSTRMISEVINIPKPTLVKILQNLTKAGILETKEGKNGGIRMAKSPKELTVLDVFNAMESDKSLFQTSFNMLAEGKRPDKAQETVAEILNGAEVEMKKSLAQKTFSEILEEMGK